MLASNASPSFHSSVVVVGAGVIGLAITRALVKAGKEVVLLEKDSGICTGTSSRNSEVIHAGLYYPQQSSKAIFCVSGKKLLYQYCKERNIPHRQCGKLIVATNKDQLVDDLPSLHQKALLNGVTDLQVMSREDVRVLEPNVHCAGGLFSPSTGIIDSHSFYLNLLSDCEDGDATVILRSKVENAELVNDKIRLDVGGTWLSSDVIINCAGLYAHKVAAKIHSSTSTSDWQPPNQFFAKGTYFRLNGESPFQHLIYPVPEPGGLGIHATIDTSRYGTKFGPDVEWMNQSTLPDEIDYNPNPNLREKFATAIKRYYPDLRSERLQPDYVGIRPKLRHPSMMSVAASGYPKNVGFDDFLIVEKKVDKSRIFHLFGIESPGLTSSLGIAECLRQMVDNPKGK